jgi:hypothetical protein
MEYKKIDPFHESRIPELQISIVNAQNYIDSLEKRAKHAEMIVLELSREGKTMDFSKLLEIQEEIWRK